MVLILTILAGALFLTILVTIHEFGHFIVAKFFKVKVEEFGIGFPPRLFGKKRGETTYSINAIPAGGFVRLFGEDGEHKTEPRSFASKGPWPRAAIIVAGVVMNLFLAFVLFTILLISSGFRADIPTSLPTTGKDVHLNFPAGEKTKGVFFAYIEPGSPAAKAGLKPLDEVVSINGKSFDSIDKIKSFIDENKGKRLNFQIYNFLDRTARSVSATPRENPPEGQGALGVFLDSVITIRYNSPLEKVFVGPLHSTNMLYYQYKALTTIFSQAVAEKSAAPVATTVSGPVGIVALISSFIGATGSRGLWALVELGALLSLILAVMNVLPIPALDGGRLFFAVFEGITGVKVNQKAERWVHAVGFAVLIGLFVLVTFNDISQLFIR